MFVTLGKVVFLLTRSLHTQWTAEYCVNPLTPTVATWVQL